MAAHLAAGGILIAATHAPLAIATTRTRARPHARMRRHETRADLPRSAQFCGASLRSAGGSAARRAWASSSSFASSRSRLSRSARIRCLLARIGPAILWISALLATLLGLDRLFQADAEDGSLDLVLMSDTPLELDRSRQMPGALALDRAAACRCEPHLRPDARPRYACARGGRGFACASARRR